jgi:hypothetical protein
MIKRIIIRNGKKYIVNTPNWDDETPQLNGDGRDGSVDGKGYPVNVSENQGSVDISHGNTSK